MNLGQYEDCEKYLTTRVDLAQDILTEEFAVYTCYNDLFAFYFRSDLKKALDLGLALNDEEEKKSVPIYLQKYFTLHLGVASAIDPLRPHTCCWETTKRPRNTSASASNLIQLPKSRVMC